MAAHEVAGTRAYLKLRRHNKDDSTNFRARRAHFDGLAIAGALAFLSPLATRLVTGQAFYFTVTELRVLNAGFVSTLELVGGICLILGLGNRIFAVLLSGSLVVALLTADKQTFIEKFPVDITDVTPFVYLLLLTWITLYGPGLINLDHLLSKWLARRGCSQRAPGACQRRNQLGSNSVRRDHIRIRGWIRQETAISRWHSWC